MKKIQTAFIALGLVLLANFMLAAPASALQCSVLPDFICSSAEKPDLNANGIWYMLILFVNIFSAGVGVLAVGAIAYAGFLYATAQGNTEQVKKSMTIIQNAVIGLIAFALLFSAANYLIPGGVFSASGSTTPGESCSQPGMECM